MTENDYIAEYVKEKYSHILNIDFTFWKLGRQMSDVAKNIIETFNKIEWDKIDLTELNKLNKEEEDEDNS